MKVRRRLLRLLAIAVLAMVAAFAVLFVRTVGWTEPLPENSTLACHRLDGPVGAEDIAIDWPAGRAYVTSADRHGVNTGTAPRGDIFVLDFAAATPALTPLKLRDDDAFFPHGLDLWTGPGGAKRLFIVDHGADGLSHSIEIYDITQDGALSLAQSVSASALTSPNDVATSGPEQFYASNDPFAEPAWKRWLETYLLLPLNTLAYFDGRRAMPVAEGLQFPNGVALSPDGQWLIVAESTARALRLFRRNPFNGQVTPDRSIRVPMAPDNITVQPDGALMVAGHPRPLAFQAHARAPAAAGAPSMVLRITDWTGDKPRIDTLFADDGQRFAASSVAFRDPRGRLFIGAVYERGLLMCGGGAQSMVSPATDIR